MVIYKIFDWIIILYCIKTNLRCLQMFATPRRSLEPSMGLPLVVPEWK